MATAHAQGQARSDTDDRTTSALSTSSHTHVDYHDAHQQSPRTKMSAWSAKREGEIDSPAKAQTRQEQPVADNLVDVRQTSDAPQTGRRATAGSNRPNSPPPPKCMQSCISSIESCTQSVVRFNERLEHSRVQADIQRRETGDSPFARKAIIPLVFIILFWVFLAYVWRLCSRLIQQNPQGAVLGSRADGIGLLVGFVVLWLMTMWSYVTVISKGPGLVKDYIPESDPPPASVQAGTWDGASHTPQQHQQTATEPMPIQAQAHSSSNGPLMNGEPAAPAAPTSLPYPSFNADLERFGGYRASSDSMRVLPGSVEPNHDTALADRSHSRDMSKGTTVEEDAVADKSAADVDAQLQSVGQQPADHAETVAAAGDPQLPGIIGPLATAAVAENQAAREGANTFNHTSTAGVPPPNVQQVDTPSASGWAAPQRRPQNDPPPLSAAALYCHRCRRIKPPRAHHCRRCGTCVLKMDHHCPWVGGCVGAHNQRFFFIFVFWVTLLELYVLISTAIFFHRGVRALSRPDSAWRVDGFLISLFPICAMFLIFTGALLGTHVFLMAHNMTTIEHVGINRMQGKERALIDRWFATQGSGQGSKKGGLNLKAKRKMVKEWDREWGALTKQGNRWWLGSSQEVEQAKEARGQTEPGSGHVQHEKESTDTQARFKGSNRAWRTNMNQALGSPMLLWIFPVGKHPNDGLDFPMNPRFGPDGVWRKRDQWPPHLR